MNIVLIGFMGSGKSTIAKCLSALLGISYVEMDDLVYQITACRNMREVFAKGGELLLRETEIQIAKEYAAKKNLILSTGGGIVLNKIALDYFTEKGAKVIFLKAPFETIAQRLKNDDTRPLFKEIEEAKKAYNFRLPLYLGYADEIVDTACRSPGEIALNIQKRISNGL